MESEILAIPIYRALHQHEPDLFAQAIVQVRGGYLAGQSMDELRARIHPLIHQALFKSLPTASDEAIKEVTRVFIEGIRIIKSKAGEQCFAYSQGNSSYAITSLTGPEHLQRELRAMADTISSSRLSPRQPATEATAERQLELIRRQVERRFGANSLELMLPAEGAKKKLASCDVMASFFEEMLKLPDNQSGPLLRYLYALSNN